MLSLNINMPFTQTEGGFLLVLVGITIFVVFLFYLQSLHSTNLRMFPNTRGANKIISSSTPTNMTLKCPMNKVIQINQMTEVCSVPDQNNFESANVDPYNQNGSFSSSTTDVTAEFSQNMNCKTSSTYSYQPKNTTCSGSLQLIGTYTCVDQCKVTVP